MASEMHTHVPEYPSRCTGCEHLAFDVASRVPQGIASLDEDRLPKVGPLTLRRWALDQVEIANETLAEARVVRSLTVEPPPGYTHGTSYYRLAEALREPTIKSMLAAGAEGHAALAIVEMLARPKER